MIGRLSGLLIEKNPPQIVLDVNGVGYELDVPMSTFYNLPALGEKLSLLTHFAVRDDGHFLYGFQSESERFAFRQLLKVSGIGKKTAERLLLELKGKLADVGCGSPGTAPSDTRSDITQALLALGYNEKEATAAVRQLAADLSTSEGIRQALKLLSKS